MLQPAMGGELFGWNPLPMRASTWLQLALATPVVFRGGWRFFERGWASLKSRNLNMFTLISLGVGSAYGYSLVAALAPGLFPRSFRTMDGAVPVYFEAPAIITTPVLLVPSGGSGGAQRLAVATMRMADGGQRFDRFASIFIVFRRIGDRDHADQFAGGRTDRHPPDLLLGHACKHGGELVVWTAGRDVPGHRAKDRCASVQARRQPPDREVAVGDDADEVTVIEDGKRAEVGVRHQRSDRSNALGRRHRPDRTAHHVPDLHRDLLENRATDHRLLLRFGGRRRNTE